jgi:hypothetical protein
MDKCTLKMHEVRNKDRILYKKCCDVYGAVKALHVCIIHPRNKHSYKILIGDETRNFLANQGQGLEVNILLKQVREKLRSGNMNWIHIVHRLADQLLDTRFP